MSTSTAATETEAKTRFEKDTADHVMTVLHDDGLYRHVRFAEPGTSFYHYDLITWPGYLTITGDMGTWTFRRDTDMFEFFRIGRRDRINASHWAEKLQGGQQSGRDGAQAYDEDKWRRHIQQHMDEWIELHYENEAQATSVRAAVGALIDREDMWYPGGHYETATEALRDFEHTMVSTDADYSVYPKVLDPKPFAATRREQVFRFPEDWWEWDLKGYDLFFLWACYAIQAGIHRYDAAKPMDVFQAKAQKEAVAHG